ncbi:uncharacterized protein LOC123854795 isoform X2 [Mirounga angustirostris]|uniref:uncharacterized protein LOC123854795 isoform X2 n=1 Tax=Mirounga angustirostris TaxID=9716 RepID=UPI00313B6E40
MGEVSQKEGEFSSLLFPLGFSLECLHKLFKHVTSRGSAVTAHGKVGHSWLMVIEYQEMVTPHESRDLPAETLLNLRENGKCQESPPAARATSATKQTLRKCSLSEWMNAVLARVLRSRKGDAKSRQSGESCHSGLHPIQD